MEILIQANPWFLFSTNNFRYLKLESFQLNSFLLSSFWFSYSFSFHSEYFPLSTFLFIRSEVKMYIYRKKNLWKYHILLYHSKQVFPNIFHTRAQIQVLRLCWSILRIAMCTFSSNCYQICVFFNIFHAWQWWLYGATKTQEV